jgi:hypothetical protein
VCRDSVEVHVYRGTGVVERYRNTGVVEVCNGYRSWTGLVQAFSCSTVLLI